MSASIAVEILRTHVFVGEAWDARTGGPGVSFRCACGRALGDTRDAAFEQWLLHVQGPDGAR